MWFSVYTFLIAIKKILIYVKSSISAMGAFFLTDSTPFSEPLEEEYF